MNETTDVTVPVLIAVTALPGAMFWRQNTGTFLTLDGKRHIKASATGVADIMGCYRAHAIALETKTRTGRFERSQILFRTAWEKSGGIYIVARSPDDALSALAAL